MVYILGEIFELNSIEGAEILEISPENFRKKLSRARMKIRNFLQSKCGLVNPGDPCRCKKKIDFLVEEGAINPEALQFAQHSQRSIDIFKKITSIEKTIAIFRSVPGFKAPGTVMQEIRKTINSINI